jgi:hypothetical protein
MGQAMWLMIEASAWAWKAGSAGFLTGSPLASDC